MHQEQDRENIELAMKYFDEATQSLPACSSLLAHIKRQYGIVLWMMDAASKNEISARYRQQIHQSDVASVSNYHSRLKELKAKMGIIEADNSRIRTDLKKARMRKDVLLKEREAKLFAIKEQQQQLTCHRRKLLHLSMTSATNYALLEQKLRALKEQLLEAEEVTETKYVPLERKHKLQQEHKRKEDKNQALITESTRLAALLKKIRRAVESAKSYSAQGENAASLDMNITSYILSATAGSQVEDEKDMICSEGEDEDPMHDQEAEVILNSYEKFNLLFQNKLYKKAALQAATSPKGTLRTLGILEMFKKCPKPVSSQKAPLLLYCDALMQSSQAFKPVSLEEACECTKCVLELGEVKVLSHWISKQWLGVGRHWWFNYPGPLLDAEFKPEQLFFFHFPWKRDAQLPSSMEVATAIYQHCTCSCWKRDTRCTCGCMVMAFTVFDRCDASQQAAFCLLHQERYIAFLQYTKTHNFSFRDYEIMLRNAPSLELGKCLTMPPNPYKHIMTVPQVMLLFLHMQCGELAISLMQRYLIHHKISLTTAIIGDKSTSTQQWSNLINSLMQADEEDMALDIFATLTVSLAINSAAHALQQHIHVANEQHSYSKLQDSQFNHSASSGSTLSAASKSSTSCHSSDEESEYGSSKDD